MDFTHHIAGIFACNDAQAAFQQLASGVCRELPARAVFLVGGSDPGVRERWPRQAEVSGDLLDTAAHVLRPESFPLGSQFPVDAGAYPQSSMLLLPLETAEEEDAETLVIIADAATFDGDLSAWTPLMDAFARFKRVILRVDRAEQAASDLRARLEESEALHTLGLATNRTLDPREVNELVCRLTRSLLGAHTASVHTKYGGDVRRGAAVGFARDDSTGEAAETPLARSVIAGNKPLIFGGDDADSPLPQGIATALGIPLSLFGDTFGALLIGYRTARVPEERDLRLARTLAAQAAVAITNASLHQRVQQHSEELSRAYDQLRDLTAAKERFYNAVAHDLRTPAAAIMGYHELILDGLAGEVSEQTARFLANARRSADTLVTLVSDLMDFAKLEAGKIDIEPAPIVLADIVEEALAAVRPQAAKKKLPLLTRGLEDVPALHSDGMRIRQILINLLSNAVKFTATGEIELSVQHVPADTVDGERVIVRIRDTGRGIPPEDLDRVFREFEQVAKSVGTGLGLPISRKLARLLGGDLTVESTVGQGSTFILSLPLHLAAPADGNVSSAESSADSRTPQHV